MLGWALLTLVFAIADYQLNGFHAGPFVTAILTNIYLAKFFMWETGYFNTLDITLDRAGYYLCWGCLCWVQIFYTFASLFMVGHPSKISNFAAFAIFIYGLVSIMLNYAVDRQKEIFRENNGKCHIWGRPAKYLVSVPSNKEKIIFRLEKKYKNVLISSYKLHFPPIWVLYCEHFWS